MPSGNSHVDVLEVVVPCAEDLEPLAARPSAGRRRGVAFDRACLPTSLRRVPAVLPAIDAMRRLRRHGNRLLARQIRAGDRVRAACATCVGRAPGDDLRRRVGRPPGRSRAAGRRLRSPRGRARPPAACCPGRAACCRASSSRRCRAGAGRWSARRARTARRTGRCRPGWPGGSAAPRRRRASGRAAASVR